MLTLQLARVGGALTGLARTKETLVNGRGGGRDSAQPAQRASYNEHQQSSKKSLTTRNDLVAI